MSENTVIKLKRSADTGNIPESSNIDYGEVALNYADGKLFYKTAAATIKAIYTPNLYETINVNNTLLVPTTPTEILSLRPANAITITANTISDTIQIGETLSTTVIPAAYNQANAANSTAQSSYDLANTIVAGTVELSNVTISSTGNLTFGDGSTQTFRATKMVTNADWLAGLQINSLIPGDIYYDDTTNKLFIWTNFTTYYDFYDITPPA